MKRLLSIFLIFASAGLMSLVNCKKDPSTFPEEYVQYLLLCPTGLDACYNDCASSTGYPGSGDTAGETFRNFQTCTSNCDTRCNNTALLLSLLNE